MHKSINRLAILGSALAVTTIPFLAWKKNLDLYKEIRERITKPPVDFQLPRQNVSYPWSKNLENWEGVKIKMEGYFDEERFLVSREKDGLKGYLVFAPFVYRQTRVKPTNRYGRPYKNIVIVCVGWIPAHLKEGISMNYDQTNLIEYSEQTHPDFLKTSDGFVRDPESELYYMPLTYITGIVRKGQTKDVTRGLNNWSDRKYYRMIDLFYIAQTFRLPDINNASQAYIELIGDTEQERSNIPIPNTSEDIEDQYAASRVPYFKWFREHLLSPALQVVGKIIV